MLPFSKSFFRKIFEKKNFTADGVFKADFTPVGHGKIFLRRPGGLPAPVSLA